MAASYDSARQSLMGEALVGQFYYVYILQSCKNSNRFYTGFTENFKERLAEHNAGKSLHTKALRPWRIKTCIAFTDRKSALDFERYLKTASGRAFAKKRL